MQLRKCLRYYEDNEVQEVLLPYSEEVASFLLILPREQQGLEHWEKKLTADWLLRLWSQLSPQEVVLSLPCFRLESAADVRPILESLGVRRAFTDRAEFYGIS